MSQIEEVGHCKYKTMLIQKRTLTVLKKAYEPAYLCGVDVCLVISYSRAKVVYYLIDVHSCFHLIMNWKSCLAINGPRLSG